MWGNLAKLKPPDQSEMAKGTRQAPKPEKAPRSPQNAKLSTSGTEAHLQSGICQLLDILDLPYTVTDAARVWGRDGRPRPSKVATGWPDLTGCLPGGILFAIECKGPRGRLKPEQRVTLSRLEGSGAHVLVAKSLDQVLPWLREILPALSGPARKLKRLKL